MAPSLEPARQKIAAALRAKVVGDQADERAAALFEAPGERWFADDRPIRVVHSDSSMFIGGLRALLLQSLHPLAMTGVARHSDYRTDPWGRLQRTADFLAATTFGPVAEAERAIAMVKRVHERVQGVADDGRPYSAGDPHLLKWVHLVELDSFLVAHRRFGAQPLSPVGYDGYVADMARVAEALGVIDAPRNVAELADQLRGYRSELSATREAREAARFLTVSPPLPVVARPAYGALAGAAVSLLPVYAKWQLRLPWLPITERALLLPTGDAITRVIRWALPPAVGG
jgi:uncharacterized protein (DUF2236 family)